MNTQAVSVWMRSLLMVGGLLVCGVSERAKRRTSAVWRASAVESCAASVAGTKRLLGGQVLADTRSDRVEEHLDTVRGHMLIRRDLAPRARIYAHHALLRVHVDLGYIVVSEESADRPAEIAADDLA
jgi:hypothetical protein